MRQLLSWIQPGVRCEQDEFTILVQEHVNLQYHPAGAIQPIREQYPERVRRAEVELLPDVLRGAGAQSVEDVVVPLLGTLPADPRLLQQVVRHEAANDGVLTTQDADRKHTLIPDTDIIDQSMLTSSQL